MKYVVGVDVGGTKIAYGLFGAGREMLACARLPSDRALEAPAFADGIADTVGGLLRDNGIAPADLEGVGLCLPSFIDYEARRIVHTANLPKLRDFCLCDHLERRLGVPAVMDNDAAAAALAEHRHGAGQGVENMLYCAVSTGLGLGIILGGRLFRGDDGMAGESGHMIADPLTGEDFESFIGGNQVVKRVAGQLRRGEPSLLLELCGGDPGGLSARHIEQAYSKGDALAMRTVEQMARYLGVWCYNLYVTFNINTYVFGGGQAKFGVLLEKARSVMGSFVPGECPVRFLTAGLGDDFGMVGAAQLLREENALTRR